MHKNKINIIFFLPSFTKGGAAYSILKLCKNLDKKFFKISILCLGKCEVKNDLKGYVNEIIELKVDKVLKTYFHLNQIIKKIYKKNKSKTIFISNHHYSNVISILSLKRFTDLRIILTERTSIQQLKIYYGFFDSLKKFLISILVKFTYRYADLVIANSKREANDISTYCNCNTKYIYPPSFKRYFNHKKKQNLKKNKWNILTVGSLAKEKGIDTIIKALETIKYNNFQFDILGKSYSKKENEKDYLNHMIKNSGLEKKIKIHGFKKNLSKYYQKADLYINSSHIEGFSTAIIDAINYNLPIICSDCRGGNREITLNGQGGDLFQVGNHFDLKKKIVGFFKNPKILLKKNQKAKKFIKFYSEKNNKDKYEKIFKKI